jgi:Tol biopolymer transport system component
MQQQLFRGDSMRALVPSPLACGLLAAVLSCASAAVLAGVVERVSLAPDPLQLGRQGNHDSNTQGTHLLSDDGRYVLLTSLASNLVGGDRNAEMDLFRIDLVSGEVRLLPPTLQDPAIWPDYSYDGALSGDGRFASFVSHRIDLLADDENGEDADVYVIDVESDVLELVSVGADGSQPLESSYGGAISADGCLVVFDTIADGVVVDDDNGHEDVFVRDRCAGTTTRISVGPGGVQGDDWSNGGDISRNGRFVCFNSRARTLLDPALAVAASHIYLHDRQTGSNRLVSRSSGGAPGNGPSARCRVADDGRVAFVSAASNLVDGDDNCVHDVFVYDPFDGSVIRASVGDNGLQGNAASRSPSISADGRRVAFGSEASNFPGVHAAVVQSEVYVRDLVSQQTWRISRALDPLQPPDGRSEAARIDADGQRVVFTSRAGNLVAGDSNAREDVFLAELPAGELRRVSLAQSALPAGGGGHAPAVSADGRYTVFESAAAVFQPGQLSTSSLTQIYLFDRHTRQVELISRSADGAPATAQCSQPAISADGRYVAFSSRAGNLGDGVVTTHGQLWLHDRHGGQTRLLSRNADGEPSNRSIDGVAIAGDGSRVAFATSADNLGVGPAGHSTRLIVWNRDDDSLQRGDTHASGADPDAGVFLPFALSHDGRYLAFFSAANTLDAAAANGRFDVFRKDLDSGELTLVSRTEAGVAGNAPSRSPVISADGQWVAFASRASDLAGAGSSNNDDILLAHPGSGAISRVALGAYPHALSADGRFVSFVSDDDSLRADGEPPMRHAYVHDRLAGRTLRASRDTAFRSLHAASSRALISADGEWLALQVEPGLVVNIPGRPGAPTRTDVVLASTPHGAAVFRSGFEP